MKALNLAMTPAANPVQRLTVIKEKNWTYLMKMSPAALFGILPYIYSKHPQILPIYKCK